MTMPTKRNKVCVYCASSRHARPVYFDAARRLGRLLAEHGIACICGAGREGLMGALADAVLAAGGRVTGIIPQFMADLNWGYDGLSETIVTPDIHSRKEMMANLSDGIIALPGGCGTLEELLEIITWKQLRLYSKPIVIVNTAGYFNPLLEMLEKAIAEHFMNTSHRTLWHVTGTPEEAVRLLCSLPEDEAPAESKYNER